MPLLVPLLSREAKLIFKDFLLDDLLLLVLFVVMVCYIRHFLVVGYGPVFILLAPVPSVPVIFIGQDSPDIEAIFFP